jgi:YfiR/HmsC-like
MTQKTLRILLIPLLLMLPPPGMAVADGAPSREYQLKAAFIFNFAQFVEWPQDAFAGPDAPLVIGIVGDNPFGGVLEQVVGGKKAGGRGIVVKYFPNANAIERCHVLFVSGSERDHMPQIVEKSARENTLTVGDFDDFTNSAGMIRFMTQDNRLRFEVNLDAMGRGRLRASAKLLKLAQIYSR